MKRAFQVHAADNVATLLEDAEAEPIEIVHVGAQRVIPLSQEIRYGHKAMLEL
jgi:hypothetical protein